MCFLGMRLCITYLDARRFEVEKGHCKGGSNRTATAFQNFLANGEKILLSYSSSDVYNLLHRSIQRKAEGPVLVPVW